METLLDFELQQPATLEQALAALRSAGPGGRCLAGGTDLLPNLRRGLEAPVVLVSLAHVAGLDGLEVRPTGLELGAGLTLARLAAAPALLAHPAWRAIAQAAASVAGPAHRTAATLGGNLCQDTRCVYYNQSAWWREANDHCLKRAGTVCHVAPQGRRCNAVFCSDLAAPLIALDAELELCLDGRSRRLPLHRFYRDDGAAHLDLEPGELLTKVHVPAADGARAGYLKGRARASMDFALAGVALRLGVEGSRVVALGVGLTGLGSSAQRLADTEALLGRPLDDAWLDELARLVQHQVSPARSTVTPAHHRRSLAMALARRLALGLRADVAA
jgi:4-hydroxybenzoyl-CoA reductase subunit beta